MRQEHYRGTQEEINIRFIKQSPVTPACELALIFESLFTYGVGIPTNKRKGVRK